MHPRTRSAATRGWDYVVVGAGAAGCVVAGRLSQTMPDVRIALIEAGGMRLGLTTKIPGTAFIASTSPRRNWNFETEPVPALNGRKLWWFQGRILGGSGAAARRSDVGRRLMTILGVGPVTSLAYIATVDDPSRFCTSKTLGAHLGLTPRVYQSDEIDRSGQISRCGDRMLRHLLYEAASVLITRSRKRSRLQAWGISVAKRRGMKRATVAVARKLAVIMHRIWVTGDEFDFGGAGSREWRKRSIGRSSSAATSRRRSATGWFRSACTICAG